MNTSSKLALAIVSLVAFAALAGCNAPVETDYDSTPAPTAADDAPVKAPAARPARTSGR